MFWTNEIVCFLYPLSQRTHRIFQGMQVHDEIGGLGISVADLALVAVRVGDHQLGSEGAPRGRRRPGHGRVSRGAGLAGVATAAL